MPSISSANLFAIGITIDIAIGFIFLLFFSLGGLPPPKREKNEKNKANLPGPTELIAKPWGSG